MYSDTFNKWFKLIQHFEGGYANDPDDRGGMTYMGLCKKFFPDLTVWQSLQMLKTVKEKKQYKPTDEELEEIKYVYYREFWKKIKGDYFKDERLIFQVADFAVNAGIMTSIKLLQRLLHVTVDGIVGLQTVTTANNYKHILQAFIQERKRYYETIANKGNNRKFLKGWLNRVDKCIP